MKIKLSNLWEKLADLKDELLETGYDRNLVFIINDIYNKYQPINVLKTILDAIAKNNEIINIFDYTDTEKTNILKLINNNPDIIFDNLVNKLVGQVYQKIEFKRTFIYRKFDYKIQIKEIDSKITEYYANGIKFLTYRKFYESFCKITNGHPSNIRTDVKPASETRFDRYALERIFGTKESINMRVYFNSESPDTTWGFKGPRKPSIASIHEMFKIYYEDKWEDLESPAPIETI